MRASLKGEHAKSSEAATLQPAARRIIVTKNLVVEAAQPFKSMTRIHGNTYPMAYAGTVAQRYINPRQRVNSTIAR
jgi:hypothetical protein